jgi:hypothetical protein
MGHAPLVGANSQTRTIAVARILNDEFEPLRSPVRGWTWRTTRGSVSPPGARRGFPAKISSRCHGGEELMLVSVRLYLRNQPLRLGLLLLLAGLGPALPHDAGTLDEKQMPPLHHDSPSTPAKELFARKTKPVPLAARSIGFYSQGCLAGAVALPIDGSTWQVMRLSRNRNWGTSAAHRLP